MPREKRLGIIGVTRAKITDPRHLPLQLRARRQRPRRCRTTEKRDELAPSHVRSQAQEAALYGLKRAH